MEKCSTEKSPKYISLKLVSFESTAEESAPAMRRHAMEVTSALPSTGKANDAALGFGCL